MFQNSIISEELSIYKFFKQLNFDLYLTKPQLQHLESVMKAMISTGYNGKVSDVAQLASHTHRTSVTRFLSKSTWDETLLNKSLQSLVIDLIWKRSKNTNEPIYFTMQGFLSPDADIARKRKKGVPPS